MSKRERMTYGSGGMGEWISPELNRADGGELLRVHYCRQSGVSRCGRDKICTFWSETYFSFY